MLKSVSLFRILMGHFIEDIKEMIFRLAQISIIIFK